MSDIASQHERGIYIGIFQSGAMLGPAGLFSSFPAVHYGRVLTARVVGPLLGGIFAATLGWRWVPDTSTPAE